jgi:hypothetical protein
VILGGSGCAIGVVACGCDGGAKLDGGFGGVRGVELRRYVHRCEEALNCFQPCLLLRNMPRSESHCCVDRSKSW